MRKFIRVLFVFFSFWSFQGATAQAQSVLDQFSGKYEIKSVRCFFQKGIEFIENPCFSIPKKIELTDKDFSEDFGEVTKVTPLGTYDDGTSFSRLEVFHRPETMEWTYYNFEPDTDFTVTFKSIRLIRSGPDTVTYLFTQFLKQPSTSGRENQNYFSIAVLEK
jgi:hypothetical protein